MRVVGAVVAVVLLLLGGVVFAGGNYIYGQNLPVETDCHDSPLFTPDGAKLRIAENPLAHQIDPSVYDDVLRVGFPSRDPSVDIAGLYRDAGTGAPLVIATHGYTGCKHHRHGLTILGILASEGYSVLVIDLREHGESTVIDAVAGMGSDEYADVLGAYDYAREVLNYDPAKIGFWGESMGGATTLIANTYEELGPIFVDAPYIDIKTILKDNAYKAGVPAWSIDVMALPVQVLRGNDMTKANPIDGLVARPDQPIFWVHGTGDELTGVHHAEAGQRASAGMTAKEFYFAKDLGHVDTMWDEPSIYRTKLVEFFDTHLKG